MTPYNSVERGGEVKFQQYADCIFYCCFNDTGICWYKLMPIFLNISGFVCNWYHSLGCYFAVEKGLYKANKKS